MKLEEQVVSLELAKKLKKLGFEQESLFYWWVSTFDMNKGHAVLENHEPNNPQGGWTFYPAYTVAELGEMFPVTISSGMPSKISENEWHYFEKQSFGMKDCIYPTEVEARAKTLIYLKEKGII